MNGSTAANAELIAGIAEGLPAGDGVVVLVCPPLPYLAAVKERIGRAAIQLGAQNVSHHEAGAFTGETAPGMLKDIGCTYVLVGHSERRALYGESNAAVASKFEAAQNAGLVPVLCVGETLAEREASHTEAVIDAQISAVLELVGIQGFKNAVVAYEPVWAIGTGMTASPEQAQAVHAHIRRQLGAEDRLISENIQIVYGGSMKGENASGLLGQPDIDGGLIGGASLKASDFLAIAHAAANEVS